MALFHRKIFFTKCFLFSLRSQDMNTKDLSFVHQKWWTFYEISLSPFWYTLLRFDTRYVRGNVRYWKIKSVYKLRVVKINRATGKVEGLKFYIDMYMS
jgi:hypothetical protein